MPLNPIRNFECEIGPYMQLFHIWEYIYQIINNIFLNTLCTRLDMYNKIAYYIFNTK